MVTFQVGYQCHKSSEDCLSIAFNGPGTVSSTCTKAIANWSLWLNQGNLQLTLYKLRTKIASCCVGYNLLAANVNRCVGYPRISLPLKVCLNLNASTSFSCMTIKVLAVLGALVALDTCFIFSCFQWSIQFE